MERGVEKLHLLPSLNEQVAGKMMETILEIFWKELQHFQKVTGPYGHHPGRFYTPDAQAGHSHHWHESYSLSETVDWGIWLAESHPLVSVGGVM